MLLAFLIFDNRTDPLLQEGMVHLCLTYFTFHGIFEGKIDNLNIFWVKIV